MSVADLTLPARGWFSGAAGDGADNGGTGFGNWRGDPIDALSHWIDKADGALWAEGWTVFFNQGPARNFKGLLDIAIGGPSTYTSSATSLDTKLRTALTNLRKARTIDGVLRPTIVRPFHELNGNWYAWSVKSGNIANFKATARRWRAIQQEVYPELIWALCFNGDPVSGISADSHYEAGVWDAIGVDAYNMYPYIGTDKNGVTTSWADGAFRGSATNPRGVERWRQFAESKGLPLYLPEYANSGPGGGSGGNDDYWVKQFFAWCSANAGKGAGKVLAEMWFNIAPGQYGDAYWMTSNGGTSFNAANSKTVAAYADLFPFPSQGGSTPTPEPTPTVATKLSVRGIAGEGTATLLYDITKGTDGATGVRLSRDGVDTNGTGAWSTDQALVSGTTVFDRLLVGKDYTLTATLLPLSLGISASATVTVQGAIVEPPPTPPTVEDVKATVDMRGGQPFVQLNWSYAGDVRLASGVRLKVDGLDRFGNAFTTSDRTGAAVNTSDTFADLAAGREYTFTVTLLPESLASSKSLTLTLPAAEDTTPPPTTTPTPDPDADPRALVYEAMGRVDTAVSAMYRATEAALAARADLQAALDKL